MPGGFFGCVPEEMGFAHGFFGRDPEEMREWFAEISGAFLKKRASGSWKFPVRS